MKHYQDLQECLKYYQKCVTQYQVKMDHLKKIVPRFALRVTLLGLERYTLSAWGPNVDAFTFENARKICDALMDEFDEIRFFEKVLDQNVYDEGPKWYWRAKVLGDVEIVVKPAPPNPSCNTKLFTSEPRSYVSWICER